MGRMMLLLGLLGTLLLACYTSAQTSTPTSQGSCHNFTTCCDPVVYSSCLGDPTDCYCDQICYQFNDCCSDISTAGNCLAGSNEPTADTGSCLSLGYDGCCNPNTHITCIGDDNVCFCDQVCFQYGDCCSDINQIGCFADVSSPIATSTEGSCVAAGFESCCNPSDSANCYGNPPTCYCDQNCFLFNDCCTDVSQICVVESPTGVDHGSCAGLGFTDGCCSPTATQNCHGTDSICYCDEVCYNFGDCCEDIEEINCFNVQPSGNEGSCVSKGFEGCCDTTISSECYGSAGTSCFCDELCYQFNDCCTDVAQIGCLQPSVNPTPNNGSCLLGGHLTCCTVTPFESCHGSDGICHCDAKCINYGDCCKDIAFLQCVPPVNSVNGSCKAAGYSECCHPYNQEGTSCYGDPQTCYCDSVCFSFGDCCDDVTSIGCTAPTGTVEPNEGSCADAGYDTCCIPSDTQKCLGHPETCHCDAICHEYGDCCSDVIDIGCSSQTGSCVAAGRTACCLSDDPDCSGLPANCMCDQACSERGDCCNDIGKLQNCYVVPDKVSGAVNNMKVAPQSDTSLNITWSSPDDKNGANTYLIKLRNYTRTPFDTIITKSVSIYSTQQTIDGLSPYTAYNVSIFAVNEYGNGKRRMKNAFTKQGVPNSPPRNVKVLRTDINTITVTWTPMNLTEARGFVTGYKITYSSVSRRRRSADTGTVTVNGRFQNSRSISGLDGLKKYGVTVAGITGVGVGSASKMTYEGSGPSNSGSGKTNYGAILGITFGIFGAILVLLAAVFVVVLVFWKMRGKQGSTISAKNYTRLLVNASDDGDDDDDELID